MILVVFARSAIATVFQPVSSHLTKGPSMDLTLQQAAELLGKSLRPGNADAVLAERQRVLDAAYAANPQRFARPPKVAALAGDVRINPPTSAAVTSPSPPSAEEGGPPGGRGTPQWPPRPRSTDRR